MAQLAEQIAAKLAVLMDAKEQLRAATEHLAACNKDYMLIVSATLDGSVVDPVQQRALVAFEKLLDALAYEGRITFQFEQLKSQRAATLRARTQRRRIIGRKGGPDAGLPDGWEDA